MFHRILVPLDGSTFSTHALPLALSLARRADARIELVHVLPAADEADDPAHKKAKEEAAAYLNGVIDRIKAASPAPIEATLLEGDVTDRLLEHAAATDANLIVLTTHGRGPLSRYWLGSVAYDLVRRSALPLLLIRPDEEQPDLTADRPLKRMLIPLDGSAFAEQILEPAMALGTLTQAEYRLLRVVQMVIVTEPEPMFGRPYQIPVAELQEEARAYLQDIAARLQQDQPRTVSQHVQRALHPAPAILEEAESHDIDLIALATHGLGGLPRLLIGSVADKVIRGATVPILVHRPSADHGGV